VSSDVVDATCHETFVIVVSCHVGVSAMGRSLVQRSRTKCVGVMEYDQVKQ
jgi:hypothetical protein